MQERLAASQRRTGSQLGLENLHDPKNHLIVSKVAEFHPATKQRMKHHPTQDHCLQIGSLEPYNIRQNVLPEQPPNAALPADSARRALYSKRMSLPSHLHYQQSIDRQGQAPTTIGANPVYMSIEESCRQQ